MNMRKIIAVVTATAIGLMVIPFSASAREGGWQNRDSSETGSDNPGRGHRHDRDQEGQPPAPPPQQLSQGPQQPNWNGNHPPFPGGGGGQPGYHPPSPPFPGGGGGQPGYHPPPPNHGYPPPGDYDNRRRHRHRDGNGGAALGLGLLGLGVLGALSAHDRDDNYPQSYPQYPDQPQYPYGNPNGGYYQPPNGYQNPYNNQYGNGNIIRCDSRDYRTTWCAIPRGGRVNLYRQLSSSACRFGRDWGLDRGAIWVANGCRAEFVIY